MKIKFFLAGLWVFLLAFPGVTRAEEAKKNASPFSNDAKGGMTYSPTEGWIKTSDKQVKTGTDYLVYQNKVKAAEENRKKRLELAAKMKAAEETEKKQKTDEEASKSEPMKKEMVDDAASSKRKTKKQKKAEEEAAKQAADKVKEEKLKGRRVLVG